MPVLFTGKLEGNQYQIWVTTGWNRDVFVEWSVRPQPGQTGNVALRALAVEAVQDGSLNYLLTVWNIDQRRVTFEALYSAVTTLDNLFINNKEFTVAAGASIGLQWNFGSKPTLVTLIAIPKTAGAEFECSTPTLQLESDGTGTYFFSVTNKGAATASFVVRAALT